MSLKTVSAVMAIAVAIIAVGTDEPTVGWFLLMPLVLSLIGEVFDRIPKEGNYID